MDTDTDKDTLESTNRDTLAYTIVSDRPAGNDVVSKQVPTPIDTGTTINTDKTVIDRHWYRQTGLILHRLTYRTGSYKQI